MNQLIPIRKADELPPKYKDTPIDFLLAYHNLGRPFDSFTDAQLLIGMCMDHRKWLRIPENFAYIIHTCGGNLQQNEFQIAYPLAVGGVKTIALIGHTQCGMVNLNARRGKFIYGLAEISGWEVEKAEEFYLRFAPQAEIGNEVEFVVSQANHLRARFPNTLIVPMLYRVEDHLLYLVEDTQD